MPSGSSLGTVQSEQTKDKIQQISQPNKTLEQHQQTIVLLSWLRYAKET
jgi:hypothetical protein